jgi:hypothetical protein
MQKKILFLGVSLFFIVAITILTPLSTFAISYGPDIDIEILRGPHFPSPMMRITNNGDEPAHNVIIKNVEINGNILYNNRESRVADILEPDSYKMADANSWFFGFGLFNITIYVSCDEGMFISDTLNGLIIGSLILIP